MKRIFACCFFSILLSACNETNNSATTESKPLQKEAGSSTAPDASVPVDSNAASSPVINDATPETMRKEGVHPISLQWISWDKKGEAVLKPAEDGWYSITGSQTDAEKSYLNIDGKIRRVSEKELEFEGTIETRVKYNNGGEPCIKKGTQRFFAKGNRTYFRLQNMENCAGGNLVDYVDIYPGTSSL